MNEIQEMIKVEYEVYLLRTCIIEVDAYTQEIAEASVKTYIDNVRDISTAEHSIRYNFLIRSIDCKGEIVTVIGEDEENFIVLLTRMYLIKIITKNRTQEEDYEKVQRMVRLFIGLELDISTLEDQQKWKFKIKDIELVGNEIIRINKTS